MKRFLIAASLVFTMQPVFADDIMDAINEGNSAYKRGELGAAAAQWEYAAQLARQNKASHVAKLLPEPLAGWEAGEADSSAAGAAMFGGGINVSREYYRADGEDGNVRIELTMDSPAMQSALSMLANPQFAAMSGQKVKKIKGMMAMIEGGGSEHTKVQMVVANSTLVVVEGQPEQIVMDYVNALDLNAIAALK